MLSMFCSMLVALSISEMRDEMNFNSENTLYYPNLVIMPVGNNKYQSIDDVSTDLISYSIQSQETISFAL